MRRVLLIFVLLLLAAGGGGYWAWRSGYLPVKKAAETTAPPEPAPVEAPPTLARTLFPTGDREARYSLDDGTRSVEWLIPEGDRVIQTYNGSVYITWFLTPEGVYRADPKGSGQPTLLRYLPAELKTGTVWKQPVQNGVVWFKLFRAQEECKPAGQTPAECWSLMVLNRGELTTFTFASDMGVMYARAQNYAAPKESFTKQITYFGTPTANYDQGVRSLLIPKALKLEQAAKAPLEPASLEEFDKALQEASGGKQGAAVSPAAPVDWIPGDFGKVPANLPLWSQGCTSKTGEGTYLTATDAQWRLHPLTKGALLVPSVTVTLCYGGNQTLKGEWLDVTATWPNGTTRPFSLPIPDLTSGQAIAPVIIYATDGVPASAVDAWKAEGRLWPEVAMRFSIDGRPLTADVNVARRFGAVTAPNVADGELTDPLPLGLLEKLAWSRQAATVGGKQVAFLLYAPDAQYRVVTDSSCHGIPGMMEATAQHWTIYTSVDGGKPVKGLEIGPWEIDRTRQLEIEAAPGVGMTFLGMSHTMSCNINAETLWVAYDHATGEVFRPQMKVENGTTRNAVALGSGIDANGRLTSSFYANGDGLTHTYVYDWDKASRMWLFQSHTTKGR